MRLTILTALAVITLAVAGAAQATNVWPTSFTRAQVAGCMKVQTHGTNNSPVTCGRYVRQLQERLTYAQALRLERALDNGTVPPANLLAKLNAAIAATKRGQ